jgi:hypothetical protein
MVALKEDIVESTYIRALRCCRPTQRMGDRRLLAILIERTLAVKGGLFTSNLEIGE